MTGGGSGWDVQLTSTQFTDGSGHSLPTTSATATSASASAHAGNCTLPTNSIGYPLTVPAGAGPPAAVKIFDAAANTGGGPSDVTVNFSLAVPAKAYAAAYTSTWTFTVASGPVRGVGHARIGSVSGRGCWAAGRGPRSTMRLIGVSAPVGIPRGL